MAGRSAESAVDRALLEAWRQLVPPVATWRTRLAHACRELGLSSAAIMALLSVDSDNPRPMRDLAAVLDCDASYVTGMVDDLEKAGYAERRTGPEDRRVKTIALTSAGVQARAVAESALAAPPPQLMALPAQDRRALLDLLRRALESWSARQEVPPEPGPTEEQRELSRSPATKGIHNVAKRYEPEPTHPAREV